MATRHYKLVLTTAGPVHIGNDSKYGKKDYFKLDNKSVGVLDAQSFVDKLSPAEIEEYCQFLETDSRSKSGSRLAEFLSRSPRLAALARECVSYRVNMTLAKDRRGSDQYHDVAQFVKDAHGKPYVPGSSAKGMLRTALLSYLVLRDPARYSSLYDSHAALGGDRKRACKEIEREAFWREHIVTGDDEVVNDIMRYISVSDSAPLATSDLVFAKKYDKFARSDTRSWKPGAKRKPNAHEDYDGNALNIYRECLRPGTRVELALDVDERIDAYLDGLVLDREGIETVLETSFELYKRCFLDHFDLGDAGPGNGSGVDDGRCRHTYQAGPLAGMRCRNRAVAGTGYCNTHKDQAAAAGKQLTCYLGGGVDFNSKTIVNALFGEGRDSVYEISRILYAQFPTRLDRSLHRELEADVRDAGFEVGYMRASYNRNGRLAKGKDDHRHWKDAELGVSPHTLKLGIAGNEKLPMGKCTCEIEERK